MQTRRSSLARLNRDECLQLLGGCRLGRVGVSVDALPAIFPVFLTVMEDRNVVFRTVPGTKLTAASRGEIVAVEADEFDAASGEGWSVLVRGVARALEDGHRAEQARQRLHPHWMFGSAEHFVQVSTDLVTGRRVV
jgi:nitroimidazol reductase NimA-like FMN-containing flavoprotein (pyridoxamine 5'-phosphate oxidase superfamily)